LIHPIFEIYPASNGTELLTAAIAHFNLFGRLEAAPLSFGEFAT